MGAFLNLAVLLFVLALVLFYVSLILTLFSVFLLSSRPIHRTYVRAGTATTFSFLNLLFLVYFYNSLLLHGSF